MKRHHARFRGRGGQFLALVAIAIPAILAIAGGVSAASRSIAVTLTVDSSLHPQPGQAVALRAKAGKMPRADDLLIRGRRSSAAKPFKVRECRSSPCFASWKQLKAGRVLFDALLVRRGHTATVLGRSKSLAVVWQAASSPPPSGSPVPPPTPPSGPPQPGHYDGTTQQNTTISFDVDSGGASISNVQIAKVTALCVPPARTIGGPWTIAGPIAIQPDRTFSYGGSTSDGGTGSLEGSFAAGSVTGSFKLDTPPISAFGQKFECTSGTIAWTAKQGP